jgi:RHH-type proline utilization regulon transcriptional repressor/proline dehydrogenase/delta 1-pyrroline-5-carboxylate dehydrogenase
MDMTLDSLNADLAGADDDATLIERASRLAGIILTESIDKLSWRDRARNLKIERLLQNPKNLEFVLRLTDEVLRIGDPRRGARRFRDLVNDQRGWKNLGLRDSLLAHMGASTSKFLPGLVMRVVGWRVRSELSGFVVSADGVALARHIRRQKQRGYRTNINLLGESVLGNDEAQSRLDALMEILRRPDVDYVSVKVSSICAQINRLDIDEEVERIAVRLRLLYDAAMLSTPPKFVNLDMEEYRDLEITAAVFKKVLSEPRYLHLSAGIVLQAYIPDSTSTLRDLVDWAKSRSLNSNGKIKIRIVKGANLAMESVHAELAGWEVPTFSSKSQVDANYKMMLDHVLDPLNANAITVGVASHNVYEICWAIVVAESKGVSSMVEIEMLQGMSPSTAEAVRKLTGNLLLYTPIVHRNDSDSAIAYLIRRFDENTGKENYLRNQFSFAKDSTTWEMEQERFARSVEDRKTVNFTPKNLQNLRSFSPQDSITSGVFRNEPNTDFALRDNRAWITPQLRSLQELGIETIEPSVRDVEEHSNRQLLTLVDGADPAEPTKVAYRWAQGSKELVDRAIDRGDDAAERWNLSSLTERRRLLDTVAHVMAEHRGELIAVMTRDAGKVVAEADSEVSEAIDFARYYGASVTSLMTGRPDYVQFENRGLALVVPPWNFPLAIPMSGVCAALAAGNAVILKPAPETVAVSSLMVRIFWQAGVPEELLQFMPLGDDDVGRYLVSHPRIDLVIMTGSWDTARLFIEWRPDIPLLAETSGKNAIIVTAAADLELAVADIVRSAFGHSGQKCSAASLAILEDSVYDDVRFRRQLVDAASSLRVGPGWDLQSDTGPLIRPPEGDLADFLETLHEGEGWWLRPSIAVGNPNLVTPGIKAGVRPGSRLHQRESFGPILGIMRSSGLDEAIELQNATPYGLTAGLHSLDAKEIARWIDRVEAGNLYVNRHITGAIVQRQPFGGWKKSALGEGAKTGGPNHVSSMLKWSSSYPGSSGEFAQEVRRCFDELIPFDASGLEAESNVLRYRKLRHVVIRISGVDELESLEFIVDCAAALGVAVEVSSPTQVQAPYEVVVKDDRAFIEHLHGLDSNASGLKKIRLVGRAQRDVKLAAIDSGIFVDDSPFVALARLEALRWCREQSLSVTMHRHGNIQKLDLDYAQTERSVADVSH